MMCPRTRTRIALRCLPLTCLLVALAAGAVTTHSVEHTQSIPILVTDRAGEVDVKVRGKEQRVSIGAELGLPSRVVTGDDGTIALRQSKTAISIAPLSDVEIPEAARDGQLIARLIQHRGNVFYDVEPREPEKLRVDTPYLVAIVKGTQFDISAQADSTTIALFEGVLEVRDPEGNYVIELNAGEIAIRARGEIGIRVLSMDQDQVPVANIPGLVDGALANVDGLGGTVDVDFGIDGTVAGLGTDGGTGIVPLDGATGIETVGDANLSAGIDLDGSATKTDLDASADLGGAGVDVGLDADADLGAGTADLGLAACAEVGGA
jgi:hypothetical protein